MHHLAYLLIIAAGAYIPVTPPFSPLATTYSQFHFFFPSVIKSRLTHLFPSNVKIQTQS